MNFKWRLLTLNSLFLLAGILLISRLFYFSVLASDNFTAIAESQQNTTLEVSAKRGEILTADGNALVANQPAFFTFLKRTEEPFSAELIDEISPIIYNSISFSATPSSQLSSSDQKVLITQTKESLTKRLEDKRLTWIPLAKKITEEQKWALESLNIDNLFFEEDQTRLYPEASMSAHLTGFVGFNDQGKDQGFYGLEGFYQRELAGRPGIIRQEKDAFNQPILMGEYLSQSKLDGKQLLLHLDKSLQYMVEKKLKKSLEQFGAKAGSVTIMDPHTGAILAMASLPSYDPKEYTRYEPNLFTNPVVSDAFEPGSIFKVMVMAAAIDSKAVKKETKCDICDQPVKIDKYTIKTWNDEYQANANMTDVIVHSDNVGMVFIGQKLGLDKFLDYFKKFGFTQNTGIDLQDELAPDPKPDNKWTYVDLATASFGQGFVATSMQLVQAVSVIANGGSLVEPHMVNKVISNNKEVTIPVKIKNKVISKETAKVVTEMMVAAAKEGEAKWTNTGGYKVAGKTGTAQVAFSGKYQEEKTNASFIGFAPADDPKFVMLVTLKEPSTSQWASETAAPLWFSIAQELFNHFNIIPDPVN
jgi:stage V sporulation protein D (sporulation-specific penicillin-binding protein)